MSERFSSKDIGRRLNLIDDDLKTPGHDALLLLVDRFSSDIAKMVTGGNFSSRQCIWELPICRDRFTVGFWDAYIEPEPCIPAGSTYEEIEQWWKGRRACRGIGIEIKTLIPSLGELVRQLRTYQQYTADRYATEIVVVSPDSRWEGQLRSQGFHFISSKSLEEFS